jgi:hypothetical protein
MGSDPGLATLNRVSVSEVYAFLITSMMMMRFV